MPRANGVFAGGGHLGAREHGASFNRAVDCAPRSLPLSPLSLSLTAVISIYTQRQPCTCLWWPTPAQTNCRTFSVSYTSRFLLLLSLESPSENRPPPSVPPARPARRRLRFHDSLSRPISRGRCATPRLTARSQG